MSLHFRFRFLKPRIQSRSRKSFNDTFDVSGTPVVDAIASIGTSDESLVGRYHFAAVISCSKISTPPITSRSDTQAARISQNLKLASSASCAGTGLTTIHAIANTAGNPGVSDLFGLKLRSFSEVVNVCSQSSPQCCRGSVLALLIYQPLLKRASRSISFSRPSPFFSDSRGHSLHSQHPPGQPVLF